MHVYTLRISMQKSRCLKLLPSWLLPQLFLSCSKFTASGDSVVRCRLKNLLQSSDLNNDTSQLLHENHLVIQMFPTASFPSWWLCGFSQNELSDIDQVHAQYLCVQESPRESKCTHFSLCTRKTKQSQMRIGLRLKTALVCLLKAPHSSTRGSVLGFNSHDFTCEGSFQNICFAKQAVQEVSVV